MNIGESIQNRIIEGGLAHAECAHNKGHACFVVWSSGAAEQITGAVADHHARLIELLESAITDFEKLKPIIGEAAQATADLYRESLEKLTC